MRINYSVPVYNTALSSIEPNARGAKLLVQPHETPRYMASGALADRLVWTTVKCLAVNPRCTNQWSPFNECSVPCGTGIQTRYRECPDPYVKEETRTCMRPPCCEWENWGNWSECNVTCGNGFQSRLRRDRNCERTEQNVTGCLQSCACNVYIWGPWGQCSVSCQQPPGQRRRTGTCTNSTGVYTDHRAESCRGTDPCCIRGDWDRWSTCSVTCGGGILSRHRRYRNCAGSEEDTRICRVPCDCNVFIWQPWEQCSFTCREPQGQRRSFGICTNSTGVYTEVRIEPCRGTDPCCMWENWGRWSACSVTCGDGILRRQRRYRNCDGFEKDSRICRVPCVWEQWSDWTCPCREGERLRFRNCKGLGCLGPCIDFSPCPWGSWSSWTTCSVRCGTGQSQRRRYPPSFTNCDEDIETKTCVGRSCTAYSAGDWGVCSKTCGIGLQTRYTMVSGKEMRKCLIRNCIGNWEQWSDWTCPCRNGQRLRFRNCRGQGCPGQSIDRIPCLWGPWSRWSACSATCGLGQKIRSRFPPSETNCDMGIRTKACMIKTCEVLSWTAWGPCSSTCTGQQSRQLSRGDGRIITQSKPCGQINCNVPVIFIQDNQGTWMGCSATCGIGEQTHTATGETRLCILKVCLGNWNPWSSWSTCSARSCKHWRYRSCIGEFCNGSYTQIRSCSECPEQYSDWGSWSLCSSSCGESYMSRSRNCGKPRCNRNTTDTMACNKVSCDGSLGEWSDWAKCSKSCNEGIKTRNRTCNQISCKKNETHQSRPCNSDPCPGIFSSWSDFKCNCKTGFAERTRTCITEQSTSNPCSHDSIDRRLCNETECQWMVWSNWNCLISCGLGTAVRYRRCPANECKGNSFQVRPCTKDACPGTWTIWSRWTCSVTCGTGTGMRNRTCPKDDCSGNNRETRMCGQSHLCPVRWSIWSVWDTCPLCGSREISRTRSCISGGCSNYTTDLKICETDPCGLWSKWTNMSCDVTCGKGIRTQQRNCQNEECNGPTERRIVCMGPPCIGVFGRWSPWSACSATCGDGQMTRVRACSKSTCNGNNTDINTCKIANC